MTSLGLTVADADGILDKVQIFDDGSRYERLRPITDFRKDIGVARILYLCRRDPNDLNSTEDEEAEKTLVMKVKVQVPCAEMKDPIDGPNTETAAELHALKTFALKEQKSVPQLVKCRFTDYRTLGHETLPSPVLHYSRQSLLKISWVNLSTIAGKKQSQGTHSLFPGGYLVITIMTLMPGKTLLDLGFWSLPLEVQTLIRTAFLATLREIWSEGFAPYDRGLRNILWDEETGQCTGLGTDEREGEMELWGIMRRPALDWYSEWAVSAPPRKAR
ncbi:uncharacterized protein RCO7_10171 [Rhynchosporium graminicola]|uniref:Fungal-type protein kinase domain-containing protein n=1 Tax=Rhynchosporium graminicola TaxID=2792576 RepID=A0A1E1LKN4_9HELO|nr:uncharacterized protein RCO7_10171 [Rhynchosporium commune]